MFKITIEGKTTAELKSNLLAAAQDIGGAAPSTPSTTSTDTKKPAATAGKAAKAETPALEYKTDVGPLILKLANKNRDAAVAVLSTFGVAKGTELKPEQYAEFVVAVNAALKAAEEDLG